jgi:NAD(P)-dependent dehydrogenase (short-subunit alcohol dehydrogenase family)
MSEPQSQVFLVTGAASGIGAAIVRLIVARGQSVMLADINLVAAEGIAEALGPRAAAIALDITSPEDWERGIAATYARFGRFDVLINNAAIVETGYARDLSLARHQRTIDTNFMGPLTGTLGALAAFRKQGHGHIATVCSMTAFLPFPGLASYAASKHALRAFHHAVALEERREPIDFTIVHPTSTETPMLEQEEKDDACGFAFTARAVSPEFVAEVVLNAIDEKALEVFMPPERAAGVIALGTDAVKLHEIFDQAERAGAEKQRARRLARSG